MGLPVTAACLRTGFARQPLMVLSQWGSPVAGPAGRQACPRHPALAAAGTEPIQHRRLSPGLVAHGGRLAAKYRQTRGLRLSIVALARYRV